MLSGQSPIHNYWIYPSLLYHEIILECVFPYNTTKWNNYINSVMCSMGWVKSQFTLEFEGVYIYWHVIYFIWTDCMSFRYSSYSGYDRAQGPYDLAAIPLGSHTTWPLAAIPPGSRIRPCSHISWRMLRSAWCRPDASGPYKMAEPISVIWWLRHLQRLVRRYTLMLHLRHTHTLLNAPSHHIFNK